jgi:hypothetical protein
MIILVDLEILIADALYCLIRVTIETPIYMLLLGAVFELKPIWRSRSELCGRFLVDGIMYSFGSFYGGIPSVIHWEFF